MKKTIKQFSARDINKLDDYERFRNVKAYLLQKSGPISRAYADKAEVWELAESVGYKKYNKFLNHRQQWHDLTRKIPVKYLDAIDVDYEILDCTVELDKEEYERALKVPLYPRGFTIRYMACVYKTVEFPPDTTEYEAREIMSDYAQDKRRSCAINYPDIKTVLAEPDGNIRVVFYEPDINFDGGFMIAATDGRSFATVTSR